MDTETLNEYLFADLVAQWAFNVRAQRLNTMTAADQLSAPERYRTEVTTEDLAKGLALLQRYRVAVRALLPAAR